MDVQYSNGKVPGLGGPFHNLNTGHFGPLTGFFQSGFQTPFQKPHKSTIWIPNCSGIQMVTVHQSIKYRTWDLYNGYRKREQIRIQWGLKNQTAQTEHHSKSERFDALITNSFDFESSKVRAIAYSKSEQNWMVRTINRIYSTIWIQNWYAHCGSALFALNK